MATWQQGINSGGFLAGIGGSNENAPRASDVNATLGMIRQNNEFARAGGNNIGLQALQGLQGLSDAYKQDQLQKAQAAFNQAHANAWKSGDTSALRDFAVKNPAFVAQAQQAVSGLDKSQLSDMTNQAAKLRMALAQGPEAYTKYIGANSSDLTRLGADPNFLVQAGTQNPQAAAQFFDTLGMAGSGDKYFDILDKREGRALERSQQQVTMRGQDLTAETARRGQDITARGQDISTVNAKISAYAPTTDMRNYSEYSRLLKTDPEGAARFARVAGINTAATGNRQVQLSDGRTVTIGGKLHGAGANAFYEGVDNSGNTVRVPAGAIAAPATSAANAQNYAMKKDIDAIANAAPGQLGFMTGITGGVGEPAFFSEQRSRVSSAEERNLYTASRRIQGRMQNQGVAAARDMGASGINTVAEAKMYFQGMPQVDYSNPAAMQQSIRDIQEYTNNYNQQYQVNVGGNRSAQPAAQPRPAQGAGGFSSLWGD